MEDRLKRVHVVGVRSVKDGYAVVMSDPEFSADDKPLRADTWEVPWDAWVKAKGKVEDL